MRASLAGWLVLALLPLVPSTGCELSSAIEESEELETADGLSGENLGAASDRTESPEGFGENAGALTCGSGSGQQCPGDLVCVTHYVNDWNYRGLCLPKTVTLP